jgi:hypothetical protein
MASKTAPPPVAARILVLSMLVACGGVTEGQAPDKYSKGTSGAGESPAAPPSACELLEQALVRAKACSSERDCSKTALAAPCVKPEWLPPVVGSEADTSEIEALYVAASEADCALAKYWCDPCVVDGVRCLDGLCQYNDVDCGPPPR